MQVTLFGAPDWFHQRKHKLVLIGADPVARTLMIGEGRSWVKIECVDDARVRGNLAWWRVSWLVWNALRHGDSGLRVMDAPTLVDAFGLIERDATAIRRGDDFIRLGNYLTIPGHSDESEAKCRVSILLSDDIRNALREVMSA